MELHMDNKLKQKKNKNEKLPKFFGKFIKENTFKINKKI